MTSRRLPRLLVIHTRRGIVQRWVGRVKREKGRIQHQYPGLEADLNKFRQYGMVSGESPVPPRTVA